ncbi:MAG: CotH kinase family protein, partial [Alloprevotella sp.]|nr:CotH kinase family protein [Alloprevotella sp.]
FTFLPLVEVNVPSCNGTTYTTGTLRVTYANLAGYDSTVVAAFRYRGATAMSYSKKSYAIKLRDANGNSVDREFFGLRNDNNWILDAMAVDKACMRNRVSTDLWNDFAAKPYQRRLGWEPKAKGGTRGRFVEVFLNGQYHGIYCMTEKMDRKQLRLKKFVPATETTTDTIHGTLFKSSQWSYEVFMGHQMDTKFFPKTTPRSYDNDARSETWASYEVKYPDWEDEKIDWGPLWNAVNFVATSEDAVFESGVQSYFDFPVLKDYYLFIELMLATDNHGKNMFFYNYDKEGKSYKTVLGVAPWDLDGTWGRRWDGSSSLTYAEQNFDDFLWAEEHGNHTIFNRLQNSTYWNWEQLLAERYAQLRTGEFQADKLIKRFTDYAELFSESGADTRETARWRAYHGNIHGDVEYISTWINDRLNYLDTQYNYTPVVDGVQTAPADVPFVAAKGGDGCIWLHANRAATVNIYTADGRLVATHTLSQPTERINVGQPGVYIVAGQKVIVK